jgi:hypothetical protein
MPLKGQADQNSFDKYEKYLLLVLILQTVLKSDKLQIYNVSLLIILKTI